MPRLPVMPPRPPRVPTPHEVELQQVRASAQAVRERIERLARDEIQLTRMIDRDNGEGR
jgi:hypothetical protein